MSFGAAWVLLAGAAAALAIVALHFVVRRRPERWQLPTARFVPESKELAPARSLRLEDRLLLFLRILAIAAAALAFARPSFDAARAPLARVIVADLGRANADSAEVRGAAARLAREADRVVVDTSGSLSAALLRGIRETYALRDAADSVRLVLVSPLAQEELDAATLAIRATWPGSIEWVPVAAADTPATTAAIGLRAAPDDPIRATIELGGWGMSETASVRLVRDGALTASDSAWVRAQGGLLVHWPATSPASSDTIGAVTTRRTVLVAAFARESASPAGMPMAWWADGAAAASERSIGRGCIRSVAVPVASDGDLALRAGMRDFVRDLLVPCGGARDLRPADPATVGAIAGSGPASVATSGLPARPDAGRAAMPWLLALALALLIAEQAFRRRGTGP